MIFIQFIKRLKNRHPNLSTCHFEASEDIITKFATLWNIGILLYKQATRTKHFDCKKGMFAAVFFFSYTSPINYLKDLTLYYTALQELERCPPL